MVSIDLTSIYLLHDNRPIGSYSPYLIIIVYTNKHPLTLHAGFLIHHSSEYNGKQHTPSHCSPFISLKALGNNCRDVRKLLKTLFLYWGHFKLKLAQLLGGTCKQGEDLGLFQVQDDGHLFCALFMLSSFCASQIVVIMKDVTQVGNKGGQHHNNS